MCGWYELDAKTGELIRMLGNSEAPSAEKTYLQEDWSVREHVWHFHQMISERGRPPLQDIVAFIVDGQLPASFDTLDADVVEKTRRELDHLWQAMAKEFRTFLGRDPNLVERYWVAFREIRKMGIRREEFYAGKGVQREEWFLYDFGLHDDKLTWARLRVFDDGSADAWSSLGLAGFDDERSAWTYISEDHYASLDTLRKIARLRRQGSPRAALRPER